MFGKCNLIACMFMAAAAVLTGCSRSETHGDSPKKVFEGNASRVEYRLDGGKTVVVDEKGAEHSLDGFPMMFTGKIDVSESAHGHEKHYNVEILPQSEAQAAAQPAPAPAPAASEYE